MYSTCIVTSLKDHELRLFQSMKSILYPTNKTIPNTFSGIPQVYYDKSWYRVILSRVSITTYHLLCRHFGFSYGKLSISDNILENIFSFPIYSFECKKYHSNIEQCKKNYFSVNTYLIF